MKPQATDVGVEVYTSAGICRGTLHLPPATTILEHLNRAGEHLRLAESNVEGDPQRVPFLAVRRDSIRLVVPRGPHALELAAPRLGEGPSIEVAGILDGYRFQGQVQVAPGQRVTDFFATAPSYVAVRASRVWRAGGIDATPLSSAMVLVRAHAVVAFSDTLN